MSFKPNEKNKLPLLICKNFVGFPDNRIVLFAERTFSRKAAEIAFGQPGKYILMVPQINADRHFDFRIEDIAEYGVLCQIVSLKNGGKTVKLTLEGLQRCHISDIEFSSEVGYYETTFEVKEDIPGNEQDEGTLANKIIEIIRTGDDLISGDNANLLNERFKDGVNASQLANIVAYNAVLPFETKLLINSKLDVNERLLETLSGLMTLVEDNKIEQEINERVNNNMQKAQREYVLREKIRAIQEMLGEDGSEADKIEQRIKDGNFPEHIANKLRDELKRYKQMPLASLEASLIKNYIDTIFDLPWTEETTDNENLKNVKKILDEDHYGLEKPKERIIEYLAVKQKTGNLKAPILCFYGPPGVGKTSLGRSIARALGRKFIKSSLGGIGDEAEIRGHRRTYVGSLPGRIIQGMRKAKTINPVFLLDEIDKLSGANFKGDPSSALLEVLDPQQNNAFNDNFLEESYDLSKVLFICTANYLGNIPEPLRDRLELIEVNSYTILEKMHIAEEHLITKQTKENGLTKKQITFKSEAVAYIIERYTREAGVRELERKIGQICRKVVVDLLKDKTLKSVVIDIEAVKKYLGIEIFEPTTKEKEAQVGIVTGLAYTEFGGDILPIEVTHFPGKGNLVLTGKLGDVMKESCSIALDYVKANADKYGISREVFENNNIHIHFPEGAVPKDGPSAGCAITVAIISCLTNKKVSGDVAMTGEVTLRGNALAIGGLREKSLAALRSGIQTILIPKGNEPTVSELPNEIKDNLNIIYMDNVETAIKYCLDI